MALSKEQDAAVSKVFADAGIPEYTWRSIMKQESQGNPFARAVTSREDSRGLFQINVKANPKYAGINLYDPVENAKVAVNFIQPAYSKVSTISNDPAFVAEYTWKNGIKPNWQSVVSTGKDKAIRADATQIASGTSTPVLSPTTGNKVETPIGSPTVSTSSSGVSWYNPTNVMFGVIGIALLIAGIFVAFNPGLSALNSVSKITNAVGTKASNGIKKAVTRKSKKREEK